MPPKLKPPYLEKIDQRGNLAIWLVDGGYIRGHMDEEFSNFASIIVFLISRKKNSGLKRRPKPMNGSFLLIICCWNTASWQNVCLMIKHF
jgi:hypothetical protein